MGDSWLTRMSGRRDGGGPICSRIATRRNQVATTGLTGGQTGLSAVAADIRTYVAAGLPAAAAARAAALAADLTAIAVVAAEPVTARSCARRRNLPAASAWWEPT